MILARVDWSVDDNIVFRNIKVLIGKLIDGWRVIMSAVRCQEARKAYENPSDVTSGEEKCGEFN